MAGLADELRGARHAGLRPDARRRADRGLEGVGEGAVRAPRHPGRAVAGRSRTSAPALEYVDELGGAPGRDQGGRPRRRQGRDRGRGPRRGRRGALRAALVDRAFGDAGRHGGGGGVPEGPEVSRVRALATAGRRCRSALAQDFKRVGDGDTGPEHRRDGRVLAAAVRRPRAEQAIWSGIVRADGPTRWRREGVRYRGLLYAGLMLTDDGPEGPRVQLPVRRSGDPGDPAAAAERSRRAAAGLRRGQHRRRTRSLWTDDACVTRRAGLGRLPGRRTRPGAEIDGLDGRRSAWRERHVFHAGTDGAGR